jgi:hypothetical protein
MLSLRSDAQTMSGSHKLRSGWGRCARGLIHATRSRGMLLHAMTFEGTLSNRLSISTTIWGESIDRVCTDGTAVRCRKHNESL